jgi:RNA polymerase sigma-70 factor (ECF subfamily)
LLRYASTIVRDQDAAQDIIQNTFLRLFRRWKEELKPSPKVSSWLYRVAHNCAVDYLRKESRRRDLHIRQAKEQPDAIPPNRGDAFRISEGAEKAVEALGRLSLREQQLVVLKVYEEKSYREISEITGLTVSNVGYILHHAMKKMAAALKEMKESQP